MSLILYQRAAPHPRLVLWVCATGRTAAPNLAWRLDGQPAVPIALRPIDAARAARPCAFTGVYEFQAPPGDHLVTVSADRESASRWVRALPSAVPTVLGGNERPWFNVLLASCYHQTEDRSGQLADVVRGIASNPARRPDLVLPLGDQVYLDLPTLENYPNDGAWLDARFEETYLKNWEESDYSEIYRAGPSLAVPDDHEYWNNFPHLGVTSGNTYGAGGAAIWQASASRMWDAFQAPRLGPAAHGAVEIDVHPLHFFVVDSRSHRHEDFQHALEPADLARLRAWAARVEQTPDALGVLVTGQSLLDEATGDFSRRVIDAGLPDYGDFPAMLAALRPLARAGKPLFLVTGDVHWGRVTRGLDSLTGQAVFHEVISSPTALCSVVGVDTVRRGWGWITGNPWPRHSATKEPRRSFPELGAGGCRRLVPSEEGRVLGDHVTLLSFRRRGTALEWLVTYFPIHRSRTLAPTTLGPRLVSM